VKCAKHAYSQLTVRRQRPSGDHMWMADPCKTRKKRLSRVRCFSALSSAVTPPTPPTITLRRRRRRWKMRGAPPPPVIRPPNAAADHQFVGEQLYLKVHQYRMKLVDSRECVCSHGIEDEDHFFFHCHLYSESRKQLMQVIQDIWSNTSAKGVLPQSVTLLLTPSSFSMFTTRLCQEILEATFQYIQQSGRRL